MKPVRVFLFVLSVFILLFLISFLYHETDILPDIKTKINIPHYSLALPFLKEDTLNHSVNDSVKKVPSSEKKYDQGNAIDIFPSETKRKMREENIDTLSQNIEYPPGNSSLLDNFFKQLIEVRDKDGSTRILHYGDSQIEGDRITSFIRESIQSEFGGNGPGLLLPDMVVSLTASVNIKSSNNWKLYSSQIVAKDPVTDLKKMGVMLQYATFTDPYFTGQVDTTTKTAHFNIRNSPICQPHASIYEVCKILYGNNNIPVSFQIQSDGSIVKTDTLDIVTGEYNYESYKLRSADKLEIIFKGAISPILYGIALDGSSGVSMDNIPLRGSAGLEFTKTGGGMLKKMYNELNVSLVILQFGVNVAPNIVDSYSYYENALYKQLKLLKQIKPDIDIIVMGISDMARKEGDRVVSYPNLEKIRDAQKNAAFSAGCAFWDSYKAMGGERSMYRWAYRDPPLARKDFVHLTYTGSNKLAEMFLDALMSDFRKFEQKNGEF